MKQGAILGPLFVLLLVLLFLWFLHASLIGTNTSLTRGNTQREYQTLGQLLSSNIKSVQTRLRNTTKKNLFLDATQVPTLGQNEVGSVKVVDVRNFPVLQGMTAYLLEIWQEHMRIPHWHQESEIGIVTEGIIQVKIAAPFPDRLTGSKGQPIGETAEQKPHMEVFTVKPGQVYYIPAGRIHSLENCGDQPAILVVGFSGNLVSDVDVPVAFGAVPAYVKKGYVGSPHDALIGYKGTQTNPLFAWNPEPHSVPESPQGHMFRFDLMKNPLSNIPGKGMFNWAVETNWPILRDMAVGLTILAPENGTDAMWLPTTDTLFVVAKGIAEFSILTTPVGPEPKVHYQRTTIMYPGDMVFVPRSVMFVFRNISDFEMQMVSFYNRPDPKKPVTLSSFALYSYPFRQASLLQYADKRDDNPIFVNASPAKQLLTHIPFSVFQTTSMNQFPSEKR